MIRKQRIEHLVSAGGMVYRTTDKGIEVAICGRMTPCLWGLPKGTPEQYETHEQTAVREVQEETGLKVEIEDFIDSIEYWFFSPSLGARCHKTVFFYLMTSNGGNVSLHDQEFDVVRWFPATKAIQSLTYENEVKVVQKGLSKISGNSQLR